VIRQGRLIAVLGIDSPFPAAFSRAEATRLEQLVAVVFDRDSVVVYRLAWALVRPEKARCGSSHRAAAASARSGCPGVAHGPEAAGGAVPLCA
jgi:hypothetical protein